MRRQACGCVWLLLVFATSMPCMWASKVTASLGPAGGPPDGPLPTDDRPNTSQIDSDLVEDPMRSICVPDSRFINDHDGFLRSPSISATTCVQGSLVPTWTRASTSGPPTSLKAASSTPGFTSAMNFAVGSFKPMIAATSHPRFRHVYRHWLVPHCLIGSDNPYPLGSIAFQHSLQARAPVVMSRPPDRPGPSPGLRI